MKRVKLQKVSFTRFLFCIFLSFPTINSTIPNFMKIVLRISLISILFLSPNIYAQIIPDSSFFAPLKYRHVGPTRGGRVTAVAGIANQPGTFYMGATGGGVWKTTDYGNNWKNVSDGFFVTPSIGDIQVSQSNPEIVYVGTGSDGIRSNIIAGKGVYKSEDEGLTWRHIGLEKVGQIGAVEVHPKNADIVFVAAIGQAFQPNQDRGIYRSLNGGKSWEHVYFHSDTVGAVDIEFHPTNPDILYAALWRVERKPWTIISGAYQSGGVLKSVDGGKSWEKLENGLPSGLIGKIDLAVSAADPDRLYALVEAPEETGEGGLYRSDNKGEKFELVTNKKEILDRPFYYCNIEADPSNADIIYALATRFWKSENGGKEWKRIPTPHGDDHDLWINPNNSDLFIESNDGGANVTQNGGVSWSTQNNQPTAELYQVEVDDQFNYWLYAGQQDNSTITVPSELPYQIPGDAQMSWRSVGGCETGPAVPKPGNHNIVYSNCKGRFGVYNKLTGQEKQYYVGATNMYSHNPKDLKYRFQRVAPIHVSPHNPDVVYHCSQFVHKTTDDGITWKIISPDLTAFEEDKQVISGSPITRDITGEEYYSTIYSIRESTVQEGLIWTGANDGPVFLTKDGGENWENVTPEMPSGGRVDAVEPSPHKASKAYVCVLRYMLGDWKPYIYKTEDFGKSWKKIVSGVPEDYPVRVVREDPDREGLLYAGTEYGIFVSFDDGENWQSFQQNLPVTPVTDIKIYRKDLVLSTMGRGFWILDNLSPLHSVRDISPEISLLKIEDAYRRFQIRGGGIGVQYPLPGVDIDYYLSSEPDEEIKLEIRNGQKELIQSFTSATLGKTDSINIEPDMATGFYENSAIPGLKKNAGLNRFVWDMRHRGTWDKNPEESRGSGPMVKPGIYSAKLMVGEKSFEQTFELFPEPGSMDAGLTLDDLRAQEEISLQIRDLQSEAKMLGEKIKKALKNTEGELENSKKNKKLKSSYETLLKLESEIYTKEGRYQKPMLLSQISYLSSMLDQADQRPGKDACERYEELYSWYNTVFVEFKNLNLH